MPGIDLRAMRARRVGHAAAAREAEIRARHLLRRHRAQQLLLAVRARPLAQQGPRDRSAQMTFAKILSAPSLQRPDQPAGELIAVPSVQPPQPGHLLVNFASRSRRAWRGSRAAAGASSRRPRGHLAIGPLRPREKIGAATSVAVIGWLLYEQKLPAWAARRGRLRAELGTSPSSPWAPFRVAKSQGVSSYFDRTRKSELGTDWL